MGSVAEPNEGGGDPPPPGESYDVNRRPYLDIDEDDVNYVHAANYEAIRELVNALPPGWKRLDPEEIGPGRPPYLHEPTGETSWRNPNLGKIMGMVDEHNLAGKRKDEKLGSASRQVKKLRLMLQAGAPLGAVEQKARLEGIDMALVLDEKKEEEASVEATKSGDEDKALVSDNEDDQKDEAKPAIPEVLVKKYKRMIKAGVPLDRVQQLAGVEAKASPGQVEALLQAGSEGDGKKEEEGTKKNPRMAKFLRMQKAGIPLVAIENAARLQWHDLKELHEALGVGGTNAGKEEDEAKKKDNDAKGAKKESVAEDAAAKPAKTTPHFIPKEGAVAFPSSSVGGGKFPLTDIVRKMVQTVRKTSQFSIASQSEMVVDGQTLYHALGSFKGVQFARDEYNSTVGAKFMDRELVHAKRHGFVEMTTSIGMTLRDDTAQVDIEGLDELVKHIEADAKDKLEHGRALLKDGYYDFDSLHALYPPGKYVVAKHAAGGGVDCPCQVSWHRYEQGKTISGKQMAYFQVSCRVIVPVGGGKSTFAEVVEGMEMFEGRRSLSASASGAGLAFVPPIGPVEDLVQQFIPRGEIYNRITSVDEKKTHSYLAYEKGCFFQKSGGGSFNAGKPSVALASSGRIVVDFDAASDNGHGISLGRDDFIDSIRMQLKAYKLHQKGQAKASASKAAGDSVSTGSMILLSRVPDEYLGLVWPTTVGFSLNAKAWGDVVIDGLSDIAFDPDVFDRLVLPDSRKRMIKALVKHTSGSGFHDLVEGKGEGTVFLLYGQPGTGKTLTAEAIAELLHKPLYSLSMGTLGSTADRLEQRLAEILQLSERWDALVLLDEADSFLEARSSHSPLERNAMVSVLLRLVEYHSGILFLTSNRINSLDPAFMTRITLALHYEQLDQEGRAQVWKNLLLKSNVGLDSLNMNELAKTELNGREIKNAIRLAMALAADENGVLTQDLLLETVSVVDGHKDTMNVAWKAEQTKASGWLSYLWG